MTLKPEETLPLEVADASPERAEQMSAVIRDLRVVLRSTQTHSRWVEKQCGVSAAQLWAMWELSANPGAKVSELSQTLSIHQSTTSNMLDKLESKALIKRDRSGPDQRVVRLFLTDEGNALLERAPQPAQGALSHALGNISEDGLGQLQSGLKELIDAMSVLEGDAALKPLSES